MFKTPANIYDIQRLFPMAKPLYTARALEQEKTIDEVGEDVVATLQAENDQLRAALAELEGQLEILKQEEKAKQEEKEQEAEAKARAGGASPIAFFGRSRFASSYATDRWNREIQSRTENGMSHTQAVREVARAFPGLREDMLTEVNQNR